MKKITAIASLLVVFTACQKADIRPRTAGSEVTPEATRLCPVTTPTPSPSGSGDASSLGGGSGSNPTIDPNNPGDQGGGDITDPLRKKDQKDNK